MTIRFNCVLLCILLSGCVSLVKISYPPEAVIYPTFDQPYTIWRRERVQGQSAAHLFQYRTGWATFRSAQKTLKKIAFGFAGLCQRLITASNRRLFLIKLEVEPIDLAEEMTAKTIYRSLIFFSLDLPLCAKSILSRTLDNGSIVLIAIPKSDSSQDDKPPVWINASIIAFQGKFRPQLRLSHPNLWRQGAFA